MSEMTYTADDYRKAADVVESIYYPNSATARTLRIRADRMEAEAAEQAKLDERVEELAKAMYEARWPELNFESAAIYDFAWRAAARTILTDGRWKRVEDE